MLNFTVGPVMMEEEILEIGAKQLPYFRTQEFSDLMLENERMLLKTMGAPDGSRAIFLTASGTGAMEASIMNFFTEQDRILAVNGGSFGQRFCDLCRIHQIPYDEIAIEHGKALAEEHLRPYDGKDYTGFLINVHETSTGVLYDMDLVADFCRRNHLFLVADAISTFLADPFFMEKWGIQAAIVSSQKALALPAGMSFVAVDTEAQKRIQNRQLSQMYFNFKDYLDNGKRGQTPFTPAVTVLYQLNQRLKRLLDCGVENECRRTADLASKFRKGIQGLPLKISSERCSNALTPLQLCGRKTAGELVETLKEKYRIYVNPCSGPEREDHIRVGHIGAVREEQMHELIRIFHELNEKGEL